MATRKDIAHARRSNLFQCKLRGAVSGSGTCLHVFAVLYLILKEATHKSNQIYDAVLLPLKRKGTEQTFVECSSSHESQHFVSWGNHMQFLNKLVEIILFQPQTS